MAYFVLYDLANYEGRFRRLQKLPASPNSYNLFLRYGKKEALRRIELYAEKKTKHFTNKVNFWIEKGFSLEESRRRASEVQRERAALSSQVLKGTSVHSVRSYSYWLARGYSLEDAKIEIKRVNVTNGLDYYIRLNNVDPEQSFKKRIDQWQNTLNSKDYAERKRIRSAKSHSVEGVMARGYSQEEAEKISLEFFSKRKNYSNISQDCFFRVSKRIGEDGLYFKSLNYEKQFNGKNVDFFDEQTGTVIEFLGDYWHANPIVYASTFKVYGKYAAHVRMEDKARFSLIETHPKVSNIAIIWESEYRKNPYEAAESIVSFLTYFRGNNKC